LEGKCTEFWRGSQVYKSLEKTIYFRCLAGRGALLPVKGWRLLVEEGAIARAEILGVESLVRLVALGFGKRRRIHQAAREFLVPAIDQRRAGGDAIGGGESLVEHLGVRHDARH